MASSVQIGICHHCSIRFSNPQMNPSGQYFCPRCGGFAVEIIDSVPMDMLRQPVMEDDQAQVFQEFVNEILASMPDELIQNLQDNNTHPPTTDEAIASFPRKVFDLPPEDPCVICQEDIQKGEKLLVLPCGHYFHPECITPWLKNNNTCPNCRMELPAQQMSQQDRERNYQMAQNVFRQRLVAALQGDDRYRRKDREGANLSMKEQMAARRQHHARVREVRGMLGITRPPIDQYNAQNQRRGRRPPTQQSRRQPYAQPARQQPRGGRRNQPRPYQQQQTTEPQSRVNCFACTIS